jgi:cytoskeletal protein CcmA (bactofilin family)
LQGGAVEGDIFHRTLSIDESSVFEGMSRRMENSVEPKAEPAIDLSSSAAAKVAQEKGVQSPPLVPAGSCTNGALHKH